MRFSTLTAMLAAAAIIVAGCAADLSDSSSTAAVSAKDSVPGPLTGVFQATLGPMTKNRTPLDASSVIETWALRSVCSDGRCRATASVVDPDNPSFPPLKEFVLDQVGPRRWVAVDRKTTACTEGADYTSTPVWSSVTLQQVATGALEGVQVSVGASNCYGLLEQPVSLTRARDLDPDIRVADPNKISAREPRLAEAFRGRYYYTLRRAGEDEAEDRWMVDVDTQCLRTTDECRTVLVRTDTNFWYGLYPYADGRWRLEAGPERTPCSPGASASAYGELEDEFRLPAPVEDPIRLLEGTEHRVYSGDCSGSVDFDIEIKLAPDT